VAPALLNSETETRHVERVAAKIGLKVSSDGCPIMGSEDFAFFTEKVPGAFIFLGGSEPSKTCVGLASIDGCKTTTSCSNDFCHSTRFDFNDNILHLAIKLWLSLAEDRLCDVGSCGFYES